METRRVHQALIFCIALVSCACSSKEPVRSAERARRILYYQDPMHPSYRAPRPGRAPDCNMELTPVYADDSPALSPQAENPPGVRVNDEQAAAIGLKTETARQEAVSGEVRTVGRVETEESRRYVVTAGADGWIRNVRGGETGSFVVKGQPLASYYSRDASSPQQAYLYALDAEQRLKPTSTPAQKDLADRQLATAREDLEFLGLTAPQIAELAKSRAEQTQVILGAPASGFVLERSVSEGTRFNRGDVLWKIADLDSVWIAVDLFPEDLRSISGARNATVILAGGSEIHATVDRSLPRFDEAARVAKLRLIVSNRDHSLLPGMTVTVSLPCSPVEGVFVSSDAVIASGIKPRVFVRRGDGSFEPRAVTVGVSSEGRQQILSGLRPGEEVATDGAFLLDSESRLR